MADSHVCAGCGVPLPYELGPEVLPSCPNCGHEHSLEERARSRPGGDPGCPNARPLSMSGRPRPGAFYDPTLGEALERGAARRRFRAPAADDACGVELDPQIARGLDELAADPKISGWLADSTDAHRRLCEATDEARRWFDWALAIVDELGLHPGPCANPADVEGWSDDKLRERIAGLLYQLEAEDL